MGILATVALSCVPWHSAHAVEPGAITPPLLHPMTQLAADPPGEEATIFEVQNISCGSAPSAKGGIEAGDRIAANTTWGANGFRAAPNGLVIPGNAQTFALGIPFIDLPNVGEIASDVLTDMIICPVVKGVFSGVQVLMNVVVNAQLDVKPLLNNGNTPTRDDDNAGLYASWRAFRDFANIFLVFGVMAVVFSQATSYGLSAYGIKKLMPKIVIAAILINLSYFICALLIDVFNILGDSLGDTLMVAIQQSMAAAETSMTEQMNLGTALIGGLMLASFPMMIMLGLIFIILLIVGFFAIFFLAARQVMIAFLVVVAPLAFIAWMMPNTEKHFKNWWSTFIKLLAIYPVVSVLMVISYILLIAIGAQL